VAAGATASTMTRRRGRSPPCPDQDAAVLIRREAFGIDQIVFQGFEGVFIELELQLQGTIRDTTLALQ